MHYILKTKNIRPLNLCGSNRKETFQAFQYLILKSLNSYNISTDDTKKYRILPYMYTLVAYKFIIIIIKLFVPNMFFLLIQMINIKLLPVANEK